MKRIGVWLLLFGLLCGPVLAEPDLSVSARVDKSEVKQGDPLVFEIKLSGPVRKSPRLQIGSLEGFAVVSSGQSQQIQMHGNQIDQSITLSYLLVALKAGSRTIGPVKVEYRGRSYQTQPIQVKVLPGPARPAPKGREPATRPPQLKGEVVL